MTGNEMAAWRKSLKMTQSGLAIYMGLGVDTISELERSGDEQMSWRQEALVHFASFMAAIERRSASALTPVALTYAVTVESFMTDELRLKARGGSAAREALNEAERVALTSLERASGTKLSDEQVRDFMNQMRSPGRTTPLMAAEILYPDHPKGGRR